MTHWKKIHQTFAAQTILVYGINALLVLVFSWALMTIRKTKQPYPLKYPLTFAFTQRSSRTKYVYYIPDLHCLSLMAIDIHSL